MEDVSRMQVVSPTIMCGGKPLTPAQFSASVFRQLNEVESSTSFASMIDARASLATASQHNIKLFSADDVPILSQDMVWLVPA